MPEALLKVVYVVFPVFCIIGLGNLLARFRTLNLKPIIEVLLYLTIPALVISSLTEKKIHPAELAMTALGACIVVFGTGLISFIYLKLTKSRAGKGFYLTTMFMNSANMAFPVALLAFGTDGLTIVVLYYITISVLVYTVGIYIAKGKDGVSEIFKLPLLYAAVIGIWLNLGDIALPQTIKTTIDMLGDATIPMMQVCLGYQLYSTKLTDLKTSFAASVIRIFGGLAIAYLFVTVLNLDGVIRNVILLTSAMPAAVITFIMSYRYKVEPELVASTVALSTIMSIVTIPLILLWLM